jgi:hypothetical protein
MKTTRAVKDMYRQLNFLSLEDKLIVHENTHTLSRWMVEHTRVPYTEKSYLDLHDSICKDYTDYVKYLYEGELSICEDKKTLDFHMIKIDYMEAEDYLRCEYGFKET